MFKVGEYVICVDPFPPLEKGKTYKVFGFQSRGNDVLLSLTLDDLARHDGWYHWRFKSLKREEKLKRLLKQS